MKTTITAFLALAGAAVVAATDFPADFPECGKLCGSNMLGLAAELGCGANDIACLCGNKDFSNGIRDCSTQACGDAAVASVVIAWGNSLCSGAGSATSAAGSATASAGESASASGGDSASGSGSATANPVVTEVVATITSDGKTFTTTYASTIAGSDGGEGGEGGNASSTPITTSTWTSVITSGDATSTVTGETTIFGKGDGEGATSGSGSTVTSPIVSTKTEGSSTVETTVGTSTFVTSATGGAQNSDGEHQPSESGSQEGASSTSTGLAAHMTAAPALGMLAAAGIAAAFL
ncbi:CFEM domain-containing protein [Chaetomidium leptoderma]|uniref:CFEM domain-containing protein n=1 Tax=Chaetomidium leptoderma TaxID=669021 RepID=A0AAN6ZZV5_9PEZI|nr:CFEM domain-containing protein [Chaetomidium leptoderma]